MPSTAEVRGNEPRVDRRRRGRAHEHPDRGVRDRQPGEGRRRAGRAVPERGSWVSRDRGPRPTRTGRLTPVRTLAPGRASVNHLSDSHTLATSRRWRDRAAGIRRERGCRRAQAGRGARRRARRRGGGRHSGCRGLHHQQGRRRPGLGLSASHRRRRCARRRDQRRQRERVHRRAGHRRRRDDRIRRRRAARRGTGRGRRLIDGRHRRAAAGRQAARCPARGGATGCRPRVVRTRRRPS